MSIEKAIYTARQRQWADGLEAAKSDDGQVNLTLDRRVEMGEREWPQP